MLTSALDVEKFVRGITLEAVDFWRTLVGKRITKNRELYQVAIQEVIGESSSIIYLLGNEEVRLEVGFMRFDMKPGLLGHGRHLRRVIPVGVEAMPTFRTVSVNSPPSSWIHPGKEGLNLRGEVVEALQTDIIPRLTHLLFE